jgi:methanogenic corrinoid protein MtbC1
MPQATPEQAAAEQEPTAPVAAQRSPSLASLRGEDRDSVAGSRGRALLEAALWLTIAVAAAVGGVVAGTSIAGLACVAVLACSAVALGWSAGKAERAKLSREVDLRSHELRRASTELEIAQAEMVKRLSMAVEYRDEDTGAHIERIGRLSTLLAEEVGLEPELCARLTLAAPLHDVGKVAIPDAILLKPGPLTEDERAIIETHAEEGHRLLRGSTSSVLELAASIALSHQEKWDGSGYPRGLAGEAIPVEGRIVAIADVFDALTSDRVYRKAFPVEEAVKMMREQRGKHFDPVLLDAFMDVLGRAGADARGELRADPSALAEQTLETFGTALERGDAEMAEGAIATAIEDGIAPATLHVEVIAPALRRTRELRRAGEIDADRERLAQGMTRRVLATLGRYMLGNRTPSRERVLVAAIEGDEYTLELQMIHDQLAAAGFATTFESELPASGLRAAVAGVAPALVLLGDVPSEQKAEVARAMSEVREADPKIAIVLGGLAAGGATPEGLEDEHVLERIDEAVTTVQDALGTRD